MTWTPEEIATLRAAVASGILTVSYAGPPARQITYQSLAEMAALLGRMEASSSTGGPTYRRVQHSKGFRGC